MRNQHPAIFQWLLERVKPERDQNNRESRRKNWWLFGEPNPKLRQQLAGLPRYIATTETAKHRVFQFLDARILPDNKLVAIALNDAFYLGVLSSSLHTAWALASGSWLGVGNDPVYVKSRCFETFPFPAADTGLTPALSDKIRKLAEQIDAHRKRQQATHADVTLTGLYNVLEKLHTGEALTAKDKTLHEHGLVGVLQTFHDELDAAVLTAYGWNDTAPDALLARLVALNVQRTAEEAKGTIRWLRPAFQAPSQGQQAAIAMPEQVALTAKGKKAKSLKASAAQPWPASMPEQVKAVADVLAQTGTAMDLDAIAAHFISRGRWRERLPSILETLVVVGRVHAQSASLWVNVG